MGTHIHKYYPTFSYFAYQLGKPLEWWTDKNVLDFGGNNGNVLRDPCCTIKPENYHCLDISSAAILQGQLDFPSAHWHHYNRFNVAYNFNGNKNEPFPIFNNKFDVILIYSVFTSTSKTEMVRCINEELLPLLTSTGILINTYLSLDDPRVLNGFLNKGSLSRIDRDNIRAEIVEKDYFYLVENKTILTTEEEFLNHPQTWMLSFYRNATIQGLFPGCEIKPYVSNKVGRTDLIHHAMITHN